MRDKRGNPKSSHHKEKCFSSLFSTSVKRWMFIKFITVMILGGIKSSRYTPQTYTVLHINCMLINMKGKK